MKEQFEQCLETIRAGQVPRVIPMWYKVKHLLTDETPAHKTLRLQYRQPSLNHRVYTK